VLSAVRLLGDGVTLNFDLFTQKRNQVICVPRCTSAIVMHLVVARLQTYGSATNRHISNLDGRIPTVYRQIYSLGQLRRSGIIQS